MFGISPTHCKIFISSESFTVISKHFLNIPISVNQSLSLCFSIIFVSVIGVRIVFLGKKYLTTFRKIGDGGISSPIFKRTSTFQIYKKFPNGQYLSRYCQFFCCLTERSQLLDKPYIHKFCFSSYFQLFF